MATTKTKVSTQTKVLIGVGLLALLGLAAYGFGLLPVSQTTYNPPLSVKPIMVMMKTADAPNNGKVSAGKSIVIGKIAMTSADIQKWDSATLASMTVRASGSASVAAFKNFKLCSQFGTCVPGTVSGSDIVFSNVGPVISPSKQTSLIPTARAQDLPEIILTVAADISSGYRGTLTLSLPSTSSVVGFKVSNWTPTSAFISKAGIVGPNSSGGGVTAPTGVIGPNDKTSIRGVMAPDDIPGPTEAQMSFPSGAISLVIGSIIIY